ncbi:hypothetical protein HUU42_00555 [bacterium]|nr:hypothetical protein [bacterium]
MFGKKKKKEGALDEEAVVEVIKTLSVNDGVTVERINWDGSISPVAGRVTHVGTEFHSFAMVEEGTGDAIEFDVSSGDIAGIKRIAISIDLDENQTESYMEVDTIIELLEALDHGDVVSVSYYDDYKGKGVSKTGAITLKDEYNKLFAIEYEENGAKLEKHFDLNKDRIIDIIIS